MSKRCKITIYTVLGCVLCCMLLILIKVLFFSGIFIPLLKVNGEKNMEIGVKETFHDPGVIARFRFNDYSKQVHIKSDVDINKLGTYTITYTFDKYDKHVQRKVHVVDKKKPTIDLKGQSTIRVFENTLWVEPGFQAMDNYDGDISKQVTIQNNVNMKQKGMYDIIYSVKDASGNTISVQRKVQVCADPSNVRVHYNHDNYDNTAEEWWFHKSKNHARTTGAKDENLLKTYDAFFQGPSEKTIYLTFDEGGNDTTYIKQIAEVLKKNQVQATYFLTRNYIKSNSEFINALVTDGNVIGNHTWHHYDMPDLANAQSIDRFVKEITETEKTYMEVSGQKMKKVFRFPKGGSSERSLKIVKDLGYSTYFWSHAYYDYARDVSGSEALKTLMDHYHEGAIYLLHPSNKGNYEAMETFVKNMKKLGYTFKTVDTIAQDIQK